MASLSDSSDYSAAYSTARSTARSTAYPAAPSTAHSAADLAADAAKFSDDRFVGAKPVHFSHDSQSAEVRPLFAVSVVVPSYRRPAMLSRCLNAIVRQDIDPALVEVIVCDDGPDDATKAVVDALIDTPPDAPSGAGPTVRYLAITATQGPAGARNAGWRAALAPIVAFTDDDTIADSHWLSAGLAAFDADVAAVTGAVEVPLGADPVTDYERDAAGLADAEFVTANCFVRRSVLDRLQGFDERYTSAWREDSDLQFRILETGAEIVRANAARIVHPVRPARWGVSLSQQKKSQFDALLFKRHPGQYRRRIRARPPWNYYVIVLAAFVCLIDLIAMLGIALSDGNRVPRQHSLAFTIVSVIAFLGLLCWAGLTAAFIVKRLRTTSHALSHVAEMIWTSILIPPLSIYWRLYGAVKFRVAFL